MRLRLDLDSGPVGGENRCGMLVGRFFKGCVALITATAWLGILGEAGRASYVDDAPRTDNVCWAATPGSEIVHLHALGDPLGTGCCPPLWTDWSSVATPSPPISLTLAEQPAPRERCATCARPFERDRSHPLRAPPFLV